MELFLTSSPTGPLDGSRPVDGLDPLNGFAQALADRWPGEARCLMVAADPLGGGENDGMADFFAGALARSGLSCAAFHLWDARTPPEALTLAGYDVLWLGGGHVPTQNAFFRAIGLGAKLADFPGVVVGVSAGSMNAARRVYAQPELPGEAADPGYVRWLDGLGLTEWNILPHLQLVRENWLDGRRLIDDITCGDSFGHTFLAIPDGSYLHQADGRATLWGEGWRIADGGMEKICDEGGHLAL